MVNGKVSGIAGEYVDRVARLSGITFKYKEYETVEDLKKAIDKGEIDLYFDYYNYNNDKYKSTLSTFVEKYVVLGKEEDNHIVTSFESMKDEQLAMLANDSLYNYFSNNARAKIKTYSNIEELVKESDDRLIVVDREIYTYHQNDEFKKLKLLYTDTMMNDYKFMVKNNNNAFYDLFNYIINTNSYYNYRNSGITNLHASILEGSTFEQVYTIVLTIIFVPLIILLIIYLIIKKKKTNKESKS